MLADFLVDQCVLTGCSGGEIASLALLCDMIGIYLRISIMNKGIILTGKYLSHHTNTAAGKMER